MLTVLGLLAVTALTFSYLGAYAVYNALVSAEVVAAFPPGQDPRPRWLLTSFGVLMASFLLIAGLFGLWSRRDFKTIESMADADEGLE